MSRSKYSDECDNNWDLIRSRGAVKSAINGKRGQAFLKEMLAALDALPNPRLIAHEFEEAGEVCAIGAVGRARGLDMSMLDSVDDPDGVTATFGIASALAREIFWLNDDLYYVSAEERFQEVRAWVVRHLK